MKERDRLWRMMKDKGIKNDYELWLFKQTDEYKKEIARLEAETKPKGAFPSYS